MTQTRRLFCFFLVTFLCLASTSRAFAADTLSEKIDQDLFLDDEGSGSRPDDTEVSGSGSGTDDEDSPTVTDHERSGGGRDNSGRDSSGSNKKSTSVDFEPESNKPEIQDPNHIPIDPNKDPFDRKTSPASFFSQPGILAAIICGAIVGLLCAILLVMFIVYRMRKKDEGSYVLDDSKRATSSYGKSKEFYA